LISRKLASFQLGYLLTVFRQRTLLAPVRIAGRLAALGLIDAAKEHSIAEAIKEDIHPLYSPTCRTSPGQVTDPDWLQKIDGDLREQVEGPERRPTPVQARAAGISRDDVRDYIKILLRGNCLFECEIREGKSRSEVHLSRQKKATPQETNQQAAHHEEAAG
jgi:hypothetical protein